MPILQIQKVENKTSIYVFDHKLLSIKHKSKYRKIYEKRFKGLTEAEQRYILETQFIRHTGYPLNLDNPQTFNEKIQWLKLYDHNPLMTKCADKVAVRDYIKEKIGEEYLVPILGVYDSADEIDFDNLPNKFVLKVNWGSGQNIIVTDKSTLDIDATKKQLSEWMNPESNHYYNFLEWAYKDIKPKIIAETYLEFGNDLLDYKIMCYNGEPKNIFVCSERRENLKITIFDLNWQRLPFIRKCPTSSKKIEKPKNLDLMLNFSKKLAKDFIFIRVDFFCLNDTLYIRELTFYPGNGTNPFDPQEWDYKLGELLKLPQK